MNDDDLQYVLRMLADSNLKAVAKNVGLAYGTVHRIANGVTKKPSFHTIKTLANYFRGKQ